MNAPAGSAEVEAGSRACAGASSTHGWPRSTRLRGTTGDDPELDTLLLRLHTETACRRGGALALTVDDLGEDQSLVCLKEKGETMRRQPVSPTLMRHLLHHADERGATGSHLTYAS
ncbi:hypothetical protein ACQP00_37665 [Dactylosporangium sp. CS-047395]|uniref:hypothetical protein n=1 Tax=Dactylosporangium sp. CS-047395 TaxID=3239936 RepID=UPI003D93AE91